MKTISDVLYKVGTGEMLPLPLHHLIVFGVTEFSGKTTMIEAAITASGYRGLTFRAKRGELGFAGSTKIPIFFDDKGLVTWRNLIGLMNTMFDAKVERIPGMEYAIQQICMEPDQAETLREIYDRAVEQRNEAGRVGEGKRKNPFMESVFGRFVNYLKEILPELDKIDYTDKLELGPTGLYMMDLVGLSDPVKNLIIASTLRKIYTDMDNVIAVLPEAKKYIPAKVGTPVKWIANLVLAEGRSVGDYMWVDTQNLKGVDKEPIRNIDTRLFGRQPDAYEIKELLKAIPMGDGAPSVRELMTLKVGEFYAKLKDDFVKVYARPVWLPKEQAIRVAQGLVTPDSDYIQSFRNDYRLSNVKGTMIIRATKEDGQITEVVHTYGTAIPEQGIEAPIQVTTFEDANLVHPQISGRVEGTVRGMEEPAKTMPVPSVRVPDSRSVRETEALVLPRERETLATLKQELPIVEIYLFHPIVSMSVESMNEPTTPLGRVCVVLKNSDRYDQFSLKGIRKKLEDHAWPTEGMESAIEQLKRWEILRLKNNGLMVLDKDRIVFREFVKEIPTR